MAKRPVFTPDPIAPPFVKETILEFRWYPGMTISQAQKSISSLHDASRQQGLNPLEVSSRSLEKIGRALSAFSLNLETEVGTTTVEVAYQGSKVFERDGPFRDLYATTSRQAKGDRRLTESGELIGFDFLGEAWPLDPPTVFYDWLYISALVQNPELARQALQFDAFTDIAFNPKKSISCQARSLALFAALRQRGELESLVLSQKQFLNLVTGGLPKKVEPTQVSLLDVAREEHNGD